MRRPRENRIPGSPEKYWKRPQGQSRVLDTVFTQDTAREEQFTKENPLELRKAIKFLDTIKIHFRGDGHISKAFHEIMCMYLQDKKSAKEVYDEVRHLLSQHANLFVEFASFLPYSPSDTMPCITTLKPHKNPASQSEEKTTRAFRVGQSSTQHEHMEQHEQEGPSQNRSLRLKKRKLPNKPVSKLDYSHSELVTPNYYHFPQRYLQSSCTQRTALGREVLNNTLVSVPYSTMVSCLNDMLND